MFKKKMSTEIIGERRSMGEVYQDFLHKRRMKKIDKWKPGILASMREEADNRCAQEYNSTIEKLSDENYELNHIVNTLRSDSNKWKGKYEEVKELYDKVLEKFEGKTQTLGETTKELEVTKETLENLTEDNIPLEENTAFLKEMKQLITKCNNTEKYNKSELMSSFSAKWNVSLKEVLEDDKLIDFKYKKIED